MNIGRFGSSNVPSPIIGTTDSTRSYMFRESTRCCPKPGAISDESIAAASLPGNTVAYGLLFFGAFQYYWSNDIYFRPDVNTNFC